MKSNSRVLRGWRDFGVKATAIILTILLATQMVGTPAFASGALTNKQASEDIAATVDDTGVEPSGTEATDTTVPDEAAGAANEPAPADSTQATEEPVVETVESATDPATETPAADPAANAVSGTESEPASDSGSEPAPAVEQDQLASIKLNLADGTSITYDGKEIGDDTKPVDVPANQELQFTAKAAEGWQVDKVKTVIDGVETELAADANGEYKVAADKVTDALTVKVEASAVEAAAEESTGEVVKSSSAAINEDEKAIEATDNKAAANSVSPLNISGQKQVAIGETIRLSSDSPASSGGWRPQTYTHKWTASPSNAVSFSNTSNSGADVTGNRAGTVTINHEWGYDGGFGWQEVDSETYTITVYQADEEDLCTITFDTKGGSWNNSLNGTHKFVMGHELWPEGQDLSVPTRNGYVFEGWMPAVSRVVSDDATYTAQWKQVGSNLTPVYVYLQVNGDTSGLILNYSGWYTVGVIYMPSNLVPNTGIHQDQTVNLNNQGVAQALDEAMKSIVRYGPNESLVIDDATWTKLHVQAGADDYVAEGPAWHLDGAVDAKYLANLTVNHIDMDTQAIMRTDTSVRTVGTSVNPGDMVRSFKNYTYDHSEPNHAITIQKNGENVINIYYQKNADRLFYDANGGEGTMSPSVGKAEEQVDVKANEFTKEGCKFSGWNTEPDGSGDDYAAGGKYTLTDGEDRLYAQWEQAGHIGYNLVIPGAEWDGGVPEGLEFYRNGNNGSDIYAETQLYAENETTTVISATPKAEGYAFVGWYDKYRGEGQGQGTYRDAGDTLTYPYSNGSDYTLDALWVKIAATGGKTTYDGTEHHIDAQSQYESGTLESEYIQDIVGQDIVQFGDMQYRYQKDGGDWSEWSTVNPDLINAGTYNVQVKQTATVGSKETELTAEATYTIDPVQLTVKANDASKVYDGTPLTEGGYQIVSGKFVGEEGFSSVTVEGTITDPGTEANEVTGWEFAEGTLADNYSVTPQDGTLTVSKVTSEIVITADSSHKTYDGTPLTDDGFTYTQGVLAEGDELTAVVEGSATNVSDGRVANEVTSYKVMRGETDVTDNYTFGESVDGTLTIEARPVSATGSASKVYDGTGSLLSNVDLTLGSTADPESGVVAGDDVSASSIAQDAAVYATENVHANESLVAVNGDALIALTGLAGEDAANYELVSVVATGTITQQSIVVPDPDNPDPSYLGVQVSEPADVTYNGQEQNSPVTVTRVDDEGSVVATLTEGVDYTLSYANSVNAGDETATVTVKGIGNYSGEVVKYYTINPAAALITVNDSSKTYGEDDPAFTGAVTLADGESPLYTNVEADTQDTLGAITYSRTNADVNDAGEYPEVLTATVEGLNPNYAYSVVNGDFAIAEAGTLVAQVTTSAEDATKVYDGQLITIDAEASEPGSTLLYTTMPDDDASWSTEKPSLTNVGTLTIYVKATNPNFTDSPVVSGTVQVTPAPLTVVTESAAKIFDGTALTAAGEITGFVNGETAAFATTGTITQPGQVDNTYAIDWESDATTALESNYSVASETIGKLTVYPQSIDPEDPDPEYPDPDDPDPDDPDPENPDQPFYNGVKVAAPNDVTYNGLSQQQAPIVTDREGNALDPNYYDVTYSEDTVNVGIVTITVSGKNGYTGSVEVTYNILKAPLTISTPSAGKVYDGTPLQNQQVSAGVWQDNDGSQVTLTATGSITEVGSVVNGYTVSDPEGVLANYEIAEDLGVLTVWPQSIDPNDPGEDPDPDDPDAPDPSIPDPDFPGEDPDPDNPVVPDQPFYTGAVVDSPVDVAYNGADQTWVPTVTNAEGKVLTEGVDYTVSYSTDDRTNVTGQITVTITGMGDYAGTVTRTYQITPLAIDVHIENQTKVAGQADPTFTFNYEGVLEGESMAWTGAFVRTAGEAVGSYEVSQGSFALADNAEGGFLAGNYTLTVHPGTLTITAAPVPPGPDDPDPVTPVTPLPTPDPTPVPTPTPGDPGVTGTPETPATEEATETIEDDATPRTAPEPIDDDGTPLASGAHRDCWVHWLMLLGILVTVVYYGGVGVRRVRFSSSLQSFEDDVLGNDETNR